MKRTFAIAAAAALTLSACSSLKDALSAHTDRVARVESAELSAARLATLLGKSRAPIRKDIAKSIANVWVDYQLLGVAAAHNDSLADTKLIDEAMWPAIASLKAKKWYDIVSKTWGVEDTTAARRQWASGDILAADHILLLTQNMNDAQKVEVKKKIDAIRATVNSSNFAKMAKDNSQDTQTAPKGGSLGIFPKGTMVPEFEKALQALKPGEISPVIQTTYGYHIIRRPTYDQVRSQLLVASKGRSVAVAESTYLANLEKSGKIEVKKDAPATLKAIANDPEAYRRDNTVLATSTAGKFTASRMVGWLETYPPNARIIDQLKQAPDSVLVSIVKRLANNELVLKQADSAKITMDSAEIGQLHSSFVNAVKQAWSQLGITPASLQDSAKSEGDREKLAAKRIDAYFEKLVQEQVPFVAVRTPVANVLRMKFSYAFNDAGFDRAVEQASRIRNSADSARSAGQPPTAIPMNPTPAPSSPPPAGKK
jgi:parvulin-like peptidyl-prolyl isomerase